MKRCIAVVIAVLFVLIMKGEKVPENLCGTPEPTPKQESTVIPASPATLIPGSDSFSAG